MSTRTVITVAIAAAPDHNHTRVYAVGEQHTIGSALMPQGLSTVLVAASAATEDSTAVAAAHATQRLVDKKNLLDGDSPQPLAW